MAFPTLSVNPTYPYSTRPEDNGLTSEAEYGYIHGRMRYTRNRETFKVRYEDLTNADKALLKTHIDTVGKHTSFSWTDPLGTAHTVRYVEIPEITMDFYDHWSTELELKEV